jgi:serpin B
MRKILSVIFIIFIQSAFASASFAEEPSDKFSYQLTGKILNEPGTVFFSPYSAKIALSMALVGAAGNTFREMNTVLGGISRLSSTGGGFNSYQAMCIDTSFKPLKSFTQTLQQDFQAEVLSVDIKEKEKSLATVNKWVAQATQGLIPKLLMPQDIDSSTKLILLNAVHFKREWFNPFHKENTHKAPFTTCQGTQIDVDMMKQEEFFHYGKAGDATFISLDFKREENEPEYSCMLILPTEKNGLKSLEQNFSADILAKWQKNQKQEYVELYLPKLKIDYRIDLKTALQQLGIQEAFTDKADFSKITEANNIFINKVIQQAHLSIDEQGLEASAATSVSFNMKAFLPPKNKVELHFDRPFLIVIQEKKTGSLLFVGRVCSPTN